MEYKAVKIHRSVDKTVRGNYLCYEFRLEGEDYVESMFVGDDTDNFLFDDMLIGECKSIIDNGGY